MIGALSGLNIHIRVFYLLASDQNIFRGIFAAPEEHQESSTNRRPAGYDTGARETGSRESPAKTARRLLVQDHVLFHKDTAKALLTVVILGVELAINKSGGIGCAARKFRVRGRWQG